jgi:hypothetical protein
MGADLTSHARERLQQRAIPPFMIDLLHRFGSSMRCHGADRLFFDKAAIRRLKSHFGGARGLRAFEAWLSVYVVVGDNGRVVTIGHQDRRFRRP